MGIPDTNQANHLIFSNLTNIPDEYLFRLSLNPKYEASNYIWRQIRRKALILARRDQRRNKKIISSKCPLSNAYEYSASRSGKYFQPTYGFNSIPINRLHAARR